MTISEDDIRLMFKEGKAAMMFNGSWCVSALEDNPDMRLISMPGSSWRKGRRKLCACRLWLRMVFKQGSVRTQ